MPTPAHLATQAIVAMQSTGGRYISFAGAITGYSFTGTAATEAQVVFGEGQDEVEVFRQVVGRDFTAQVSGILDGEDEQAYDLQTLFSTDDTEVLFTRVMPDAGWAWPFGKLNISGLLTKIRHCFV